MQDRRNHWREGSLPQKRFANSESFSSYPMDPNDLPLISEQERVILLPTPYASPSAYSPDSFCWEPAENQTIINHDNHRSYDTNIAESFCSDSIDNGWSSKDSPKPHLSSQPERFVQFQQELPSHGLTAQDHVPYEPRQGREIREYPSPRKRRSFENPGDNNVEYGANRYDRNSSPGIHSHAAVYHRGNIWNETFVPNTRDDGLRYQNNRPVERGPEEQLGYLEAKANVPMENYHDFSVNNHVYAKKFEDEQNHYFPEQSYREHIGSHMQAPVPLFPEGHPGYGFVNKPAPFHHRSSQYDRTVAYASELQPEARQADDCTLQQPPMNGHLETNMLELHPPEAWRADANRLPHQAAPSVVSIQAQFQPPFKQPPLVSPPFPSGSLHTMQQPPEAGISIEDLPWQQRLPAKPECKQVESRAAAAMAHLPVVTVRTVAVATPLDIEEGELVDSDDEGALVIDESEDHETGKAAVSRKKTDESQHGQSKPPSSVGPVNGAVISQRIQPEIQQAKKTCSTKGNPSMPHIRNSQALEKSADEAVEEPGLYPMAEPELMARELLKQPDFVRQLCLRTEQKFSTFSFLWQAVGQVKNILAENDQSGIKAFETYVAEKLPKCWLNSRAFSNDISNQGELYTKEIEFFDKHYHGDPALWKKNVLQYYRRIVHWASQRGDHSTKSSSNNLTLSSSSQNVWSQQSDLLCDQSRGPVPHQRHHCASKHSDRPKEEAITGHSGGFHDSLLLLSPHPTITPGADVVGEESSPIEHTSAAPSTPASQPLQPPCPEEVLQNSGPGFLPQDSNAQRDGLNCDGEINAGEYSMSGPTYDSGAHCKSEDLHTRSGLSKQCDDWGSHRKTRASDQEVRGSHPQGEHHLQDGHHPTLSCLQTDPAQVWGGEYSFEQYGSLHQPTSALGSCRVSPHRHLDTAQQHGAYCSPHYPPSDTFMPLHVTSNHHSPLDSGGGGALGRDHDGGKQPHAYEGGHRAGDYHGEDLHTRREDHGSYHHSAPDHSTAGDQPYDPALPLMDLSSFHDSAGMSHRVGGMHLPHGRVTPPPPHISSTSRGRGDVKDQTHHFKTTYPPLASNVQAFPRADVGSNHSPRKPQHDRHVSGEYSRSFEASTSLGYAPAPIYKLGHKRKRQSKWQPRLSKKQRKRLRRRQSMGMETFLPGVSGHGARRGQYTAKPSGPYGKTSGAEDSHQRKHHYAIAKKDYSDEDLEVLELRKEVIMSIVSNTAEKNTKRARATHRPADRERLELQEKGYLHDQHGGNVEPSLSALQSNMVHTEDKAEVAFPNTGTVQCSGSADGLIQQAVQPSQNSTVGEVPPAHITPTVVGGNDRPNRSTLVHNRGDDSPVPSPLVAMLKMDSSKGNKSRSASPLQKPRSITAIKVVPRDTQTHKVQDFSIQISNVSETSESEADSDEPPVLTWQRSSAIPTSDDIDQLVKGLRKDSENEQRVLASPQIGTMKLLPPGQQQEYNELKLRLALCKKRNKRGLLMGAKVKPKVSNIHAKRGSAPAVLVSRQLKANKPTLVPKAADVNEIKNRIEICAKLIKNHRSCIDNEVLAQNELVKQQAIYEQELDGSSLRLQLLEKKLKDARDEHQKCEAALSEVLNKALASKDVVAQHTSHIKEKDNEVRLLQRKLQMMSQQQSELPQVVDNDKEQDEHLLHKLSTDRDYEVVSPSYPQYECVSDAEDTCAGNGSLGALTAHALDLQPSLHDADMKGHPLSPLETEMISDTESVEPNPIQSTDRGCDVRSMPTITVEMVSDSEDAAAAQLGKDGDSVSVQPANGGQHSGHVIEQVSDAEDWCLAYSGDEAKSMAAASGVGQSSLTEAKMSPATLCAGNVDVHLGEPLTLTDNSPSPVNSDVPQPAIGSPTTSLDLEKPLQAKSKQPALVPASKNKTIVTNAKVVGTGSVLAKVPVKVPLKAGLAISMATKQKGPSQTLPTSSNGSIHQNTKPLHVVSSSIAQKGVQPAKNITAGVTAQLSSQSAGAGLHSSKSVAAKYLATHSTLASHRTRLSAASAMNQKSFHKPSPKRLVHSKATELHGRLQKELLALEALKAARKVKSANIKVTGEVQGTRNTSPLSIASSPLGNTEAGANVTSSKHAELSDQLKQAIKALGIQCLPADILERVMLPSKPNLNTLLSSPQVAAIFRPTSVSYDTMQQMECSVGGAMFVPESVILAAEKQERQRHQGGGENDRVYCSPFTGYVSPLLAFHSYRLSPHFAKFASLTSLTYSNKIDPIKMMCRFELLGCCNDSSCPAQHFKDIKLSKEEMAKDLISYCPALAGCSEDMSFVDDSLPESQQNIFTKVDLYAKSLCDSFSTKLSDEQLCLYIAHKVTLGRREVMGTSGIDLDERAWCSSSAASQHKKLVKDVLPFSDMVSDDTGKNQSWDIGLDNSSGVQRYYNIESTTVDTGQNPCDPSGWVIKAQKAAQTGSLGDACSILKTGLLSYPTSEEIWVHLLQAAHGSKVIGSELDDATQPEALCSRALEACPTYSVVFECVRQALTFGTKRSLIVGGYKTVISKNCSTMEEKSHSCLELLLNAVVLEQMCGAHEQATSIMQHALFTQSDQTTCSPWTDIKRHLTKEDQMFFVLCFGHYLYHSCLPLTALFGSDGACPPVRIISKEPFFIPLNSTVICGSEKHEQIVQLFQSSLIECVTQDPSIVSGRMCNMLCQNLFQFETACGNIQKAQALLTELSDKFPSNDDFWLLLAKLNEQESTQKCIDTLTHAVTQCPRSADLYYCAASILSAAGHTSEAISWLKCCVEQYYISEGLDVSIADVFVLYRKLLGQLVPYQYNFPPFSSFVDGKHLGLNLVSLWKCYILLIKLSPPVAGREYYHSSVEDAFESAVHCIHDQLRLRLLWREYLVHLKLQVLDSPTVHNFKVFSDCVERCIEAITFQGAFPYRLAGQPSEFSDYSFHNEAVGLFLDCSPVNSSARLFYITKFLKLLPKNWVFVSRLVQCALSQSPEETELAQVVLANYLAEDPSCCLLWKMAILLELRLGHTREARWMYRQATHVLPLQRDLWKEFLLFELHELQHSRSSPSIIHWLVERCNQVGLDLIPFEKPPILQSLDCNTNSKIFITSVSSP